MDKTNEVLNLGVGRRDITPAVGGRLYGYRPDVFSSSVNDALSVTAAAFFQGEAKAIFISATVCLISSVLADRIKNLVAAETGAEHIIISATHTHSGPNTCGSAGWGEIDAEYCENIFVPRISEAAKEAVSALKPAVMGVGTVRSRVGMNRRQHNADGTISLGQNPWGIFDDTMTVLRFSEPCGKPVLNLVHYGAHCTAAGMNTEITRDWAGVMLDRLETESGAPAMFVNGAEGDVGPRLSNGHTTGDISHVRELGGIAALDAVAAWRNAKNCKPADIFAAAGDLVLPLKPRMPYEEAKKRLEKTPENEINIAGHIRQHYKDIIAAYDNNIPEETQMTLPQTLVAIGDVLFVPFPFEMFSEISLRLRRYSRFEHTLCMGVTNGSHGYLPSRDQICRGGYEVDVFAMGRAQPFADNTDDNIINENLRLTEKLP